MGMSFKVVMVSAALLAAPAGAWAQVGGQSGAIAGAIEDATGAVLPGVTVEAASPALIERVRTAVTNANGQYMIAELRPGTYTVTFSLPGFSTVEREGIELTTGFTATVSAALEVGNVTETITVSGSSPVIDLRNVSQARVMTREVVDLLPTGKLYSSLAELVPGMLMSGSSNVTRDLGGNAGNVNNVLSIHGGRSSDQQVQIDGMPIASLYKVSSNRLTFPDSNVEETTLQYSSHTAADESGGVYVKVVPRSGSNTFRGWMFANFTNGSLQRGNISDELAGQGVAKGVKGNEQIFDINPAFGGPIKQDRLWFFVGVRRWDANRNTTFFPDSDLTDNVYTPDVSATPIPDDHPERSVAGRITWQASTRNTINVNFADTNTCQCHWGLGRRAQGAVNTGDASQIITIPYHLVQGTWQMPTNRWLFEAGGYSLFQDVNYDPQATARYPARQELNGLFNFGARPGHSNHSKGRDYFGRASVSRVTGSHATKIGAQVWWAGIDQAYWEPPTNYHVRLLNGQPREVVFLATPYNVVQSVVKTALYAQDQWTLNEMTVNAGLRFDLLTSGYPDLHLPATSNNLPARDFPAASVLNWRDLSPRLGLAYNLLGNDRTVLKVSVNRYVLQEGGTLTSRRNPANASNGLLRRTWNDANGDFIPQGNPVNPAPNGELGPSPDRAWGGTKFRDRLDPNLQRGFAVRPYQWEIAAGIQHELVPRVSVDLGYFRRIYGNFLLVDNTAVGPADFDPYCITTPTHSQLPGGGGQEICGLFDLQKSKLGARDNLQTRASNFGKQTEHFSGVDLSMSARLPRGLLLQGGMSTGKTTTDNCDVVTKVDNPSTLYCNVESPFLTQVKFLGSAVLPGDIQVAATYQNAYSKAVTADYIATNAQIAPSLGRDLSAGARRTVRVNIVEPLSMYQGRLQQVDLRFSRSFSAGGSKRIRGMVDFYNVLNANPVLVWNNGFGTTGGTWLKPQDILGGGFVKFGVQMDF